MSFGPKDKAVVVFSGGQDSVTCLAWAKTTFSEVVAVGFNYGQRHEVELRQAGIIAREMDVKFRIFDIPVLAELNDSALTNHQDEIGSDHYRNSGLPASFVPNRNAMFITAAHAFAQRCGAGVVVLGVCQTDYSGYPDCRQEFIDAMRASCVRRVTTNTLRYPPSSRGRFYPCCNGCCHW